MVYSTRNCFRESTNTWNTTLPENSCLNLLTVKTHPDKLAYLWHSDFRKVLVCKRRVWNGKVVYVGMSVWELVYPLRTEYLANSLALVSLYLLPIPNQCLFLSRKQASSVPAKPNSNELPCLNLFKSLAISSYLLTLNPLYYSMLFPLNPYLSFQF